MSVEYSFRHAGDESNALPAVVYVLYLVGLFHGLTLLVGLVIAYVARRRAGPRMASHYTWLIDTFWFSLGLAAAGLVLYLIGYELDWLHIGQPALHPVCKIVGLGAMAAAWLYGLLRVIGGGLRVLRGEAC